ncbi:MAG: gliding motility-associated C-terminal domain-containing protein [Bacteroidia bacterium]|jgi:gliding motility-associated-like protein|nr:gliding motility-associated C-terminal domain-containing protein [Bacteroidia bacterium]
MNKHLTLFIILLAGFTGLRSQTVCNAAGNVMIYSNYEGGNLTIDVDVNIPNLKIGICTYEAVAVNITGAFAGNVTGVIYAGFEGLNNTNCGPAVPAVSITGVPASIVNTYTTTDGNTAIANFMGDTLQFMTIPLVNCMVGAEGCGQTASGGGNSSPQIVQFFLSEFGAGSSLYAHYTDYVCFPASTMLLSNGGNCCLQTPSTAPNPIYRPGATYDFIPSDDTLICSGSITIDLSFYPVLFQPPTYPGYVWSDGTIGPLITITQPGVYSFTVGDYCHGSWSTYLTDTIVVLPCCSLTNSVATATPATCNGGTNGTASATPGSGDAPFTYNWLPAGGNASTATGLAAGTYICIIADSSGCLDTVTALVNQPTAIIATPTSVNALCPTDNSGSATVAVSGGTPGYQYAWSTSPPQTTATATSLAPGSYSCTVTDLNNCTATFTVAVGSGAGPLVTVGPGVSILFGNSTTLTASGASTYSWAPAAGLSCTNCASPVASPSVTTTYTVTGTDANGCSNSAVITVTVDLQCGDVFVPNVFSPNNDGLNDQLMVYGNCVTEMQFEVYDRWGNRVYTGTNPDEGWDGSRNGTMLDNGIYAWQLSATLVNGQTVKLSGDVQLMQ